MGNQIRPELSSILNELRGKIKRYVLIEGTALILIVLGLLFWLSLGVDHAWFQLSRLELPVWFRATFDVFVVAGVVGLLFSWVLFRFFRSFRAKALALVLERRFPELNDRLVTAVELAESKVGDASPLTEAMLKRTIDDVVSATKKIDVTNVFDKKPMRRSIVLAALLVASIGGLAAANQSILSTWVDSFLDLDAEYWNRENDLVIKVIAQPGDTVREFRDRSYKHPRGSDLTLLIQTKEGSKPPQDVQLKYRLRSGRGGGTVVCSKVGTDQFKHSLAGLLEDVEFKVYGGDFVTRKNYRIEVVDPPRLSKIALACNYPAYTGMGNPESTPEKPLRDPRPVLGTQVAVPNETEFLLQAQSNKKLTMVQIQYGANEITFRRDNDGKVDAMVIVRSEDGKTVSQSAVSDAGVANWLADDDKRIAVPFVISHQESDAAKTRIESLTTECGKPFVIAPDTQVRIYMQDEDEILTAEPERMLINGIPDAPPSVETKLRGIGTSITRRASIPIIGTIMDDLGLENVRFSYQVNDDPEWKDLELDVRVEENHPSTGFLKEFQLQLGGVRNENDTIIEQQEKDRQAGKIQLDPEEESRSKYARFDVTPLDLSLGQQLVLTVVARDRDKLNGPHETRSERYTFKVVSKEELLSVLYQRELNLRRQFERLIEETRETQQDLIRHSIRVDEKKQLLGEEASDENKAKIKAIDTAVSACGERSWHGIQKNKLECRSIQLAFGDIREELVNNALHTPQTLARLDEKVIAPLNTLNVKDYKDVDEVLGLLRLANRNGQDPTTHLTNAIETLEVMIKRMVAILAEMEKLETFQEALEQLKAIIGKQEELRERLRKEQKKRLIQGL